MKIILFTDSLGPGGAQRQLVGLAVMLKERGYDVSVCTYFDVDFYKSQLDDAGVQNVIIPNATNTKKRIMAVRSYFKHERPDWVIAYQETPSLVACAAKVLGCNYKLIVSERNTTQVVGMNERVRFFLYRWADAIVPNSYAQERWLSSHYNWMKSKIVTITNFVDLNRFTPISHIRRSIPEIVVAATIWESKNTIGLIHALDIIKQKGIKCHFSWYGKSELNIDYYNRCIELINQVGVQDYIDLLPKTKNIKNKYQEADYFCLPSFYEGTPNVLCEAIACGLPVIVSNVCDNALYAQDGKNAVLFNPQIPESIALSIEKVLDCSESTYTEQCIESRKIAEEQLSSEVFFNKYLKILKHEQTNF